MTWGKVSKRYFSGLNLAVKRYTDLALTFSCGIDHEKPKTMNLCSFILDSFHPF
jgi:hypothetical protein